MLKEHAKIDNVLDFDLSLNTVEEINKMQEKGDVKVTTIVQNEKKVSLKDQFVMAFTSNLRALAELNISQNELKVITYILEVMEFGNLISINQTSIAKELGLHKSNVSYTFKRLVEKNILIKKDGHTFMNSNLFAKGLNHSMNEERRANLRSAQVESEHFKRSF
ncbi:replication/maintenance protein RepL [Escherichia coli]|uniref:replication/maintenance protein RepL n=1 Tax=Escherichia coli TaxID=562 RepID=UPI001BD51C3D|nr:replication/maintenance protein RepL [Escherichia coli]MBS9668730.1 replication/maintenance protein RepL [Escherichia coli]MCW4558377.1 replication/maintenance protein RepL [Escherichia coli]HDX2587281.1 replication/maintenance protein RepL [Escherichia coli]